jgi:hypothetical protein
VVVAVLRLSAQTQVAQEFRAQVALGQMRNQLGQQQLAQVLAVITQAAVVAVTVLRRVQILRAQVALAVVVKVANIILLL